MHQLTKHLLINRGIIEEKEQEEFLNPDYNRDVGDPFQILNMEKAVLRILDAMRKGEEILIFGDYDCDGIPGSVILHDAFKKIGYENFRNYIPHRHNEGFGLSVLAVESFIKEGADLIITVDCGITDIEAAKVAKKAGVDVIITDHHIPGEALPDVYAIVNSKQKDDTYHDDMLCGAGVAFKIVQALIKIGNFKDIPNGYEKWLLDMVGIATIADMVPLVKENRALAYFGLKVLRKSMRPGLNALLMDAKVDQRYLSEDDIGFAIAPRINAASRMSDPSIAFKMLASDDKSTAIAYAKELEKLNNSRKLITKEIVKEAHLIISKQKKIKSVLVIGKKEWSVGVAGIVAAQLVEHYTRPVFVWCGEDGEIKGSCRSDGTVSLHELMHAVPEGIFSAKGGHDGAGGFSVIEGKINDLDSALNKAHETVLKSLSVKDNYVTDGQLQLRDVNSETYNAISLLAPFGEGNRKPIFSFPHVIIFNVEQFGKTKEHLKITLIEGSKTMVEAIAWFKTADDYAIKPVKGMSVNLIGYVEESRFLGRVSLRLKIVDILNNK
jgi:single-stranded-DNA-specific exonuclease